ncbi:MAG TPA: methyltransferase [Aggregatilineaceae bacterium]|nr:methyltransferase [Aggregatilineaceae bacterium]
MPQRFLNPTSGLFTRSATINPGERVLLVNSDDSALAEWVVKQAGSVIALHPSGRALKGLGRVKGVEISPAVFPDPNVHGVADVALFEIPKGREYVRAYLWTVAQTLKPGGLLYLGGANDAGAKTAIKDADELFGRAAVLGYKSSERVAVAIRPDTLQLPAEWDRPAEAQTRQIVRPDGEITIVTQPGVFSWDHLDKGTELLLDHLGVKAGDEVLDIGCGYGIIGIAAARVGANVVMVDDDLLAVRCAQGTVAANGLEAQCTVIASDVTSEIHGRKFDLVLSNPPFHKGLDVTTGITQRLVNEAADVLKPGGRLRIIANRFLPYDRMLRERFGHVQRVAETISYYVLEV